MCVCTPSLTPFFTPCQSLFLFAPTSPLSIQLAPCRYSLADSWIIKIAVHGWVNDHASGGHHQFRVISPDHKGFKPPLKENEKEPRQANPASLFCPIDSFEQVLDKICNTR
jgi:hypothetical protein